MSSTLEQPKPTPVSNENSKKTKKRKHSSSSNGEKAVKLLEKSDFDHNFDEIDFDEIREWSLDEKLANKTKYNANFLRHFDDAKS